MEVVNQILELAFLTRKNPLSQRMASSSSFAPKIRDTSSLFLDDDEEEETIPIHGALDIPTQSPENSLLQLRSLLEKLSDRALKTHIKTAAENGTIGEFARALFAGFVGQPTGQAHTIQYIIETLQVVDVSEKQISELLSVFSPELKHLVEFCHVLLCTLTKGLTFGTSTSGKEFALLPKILDTIAASSETFPELQTGEDTESQASSGEHKRITAHEYKTHFLHYVSRLDWPRNLTLNLTACLRDLSYSPEQLKILANKLCEQLPNFKLDELPQFVGALILFSSKGELQTFMTAILEYFHRLDEQYAASKGKTNTLLRQTESAVLVELEFSFRQDQEFCRKFLKILKPIPIWGPFIIGSLLVLSKAHRFQDQVFQLLKQHAGTNFRESKLPKTTPWLKNLIKSSSNQNYHQHFLECVDAVPEGWDLLVYPLQELGFCFLESHNVRTDPSSAGLSETGAGMLKQLFQVDRSSRPELLQGIFSRIISRSEHTQLLIDLLQMVIQELPQVVLHHVDKIKEILDALSLFPPSVVFPLLDALKPIVRMHSSLEDHTILVLKKALFNREEEARLAAQAGFLMLLEREQSSEKGLAPTAYEFFSSLRRCLSQQAIIRQRLYENLPRLLSQNPDLSEPICDLLAFQLAKYCDYQSSNCIIRISDCVERSSTPTTIEPLQYLLDSISNCLTAVPAKFKSIPSIAQLSKTFIRIYDFALNQQSSDWDIPTSSDVLVPTHLDGPFNTECAQILVGVYDAMINYSVLNNRTFEESNDFFQHQKMIHDALKFKPNCRKARDKSEDKPPVPSGSNTKAKKITKAPPKDHIGLLLKPEVLLSLVKQMESSSLSTIEIDPDFKAHIFELCFRTVTNFKTSLGRERKQHAQFCHTLGRSMGTLLSKLDNEDDKIILRATEILAAVFEFTFEQDGDDSHKTMLLQVLAKEQDNSLNSIANSYMSSMQEKIVQILKLQIEPAAEALFRTYYLTANAVMTPAFYTKHTSHFKFLLLLSMEQLNSMVFVKFILALMNSIFAVFDPDVYHDFREKLALALQLELMGESSQSEETTEFRKLMSNPKTLDTVVKSLLISIQEGCAEMEHILELVKLHGEKLQLRKGLSILELKDMGYKRMNLHLSVLIILVDTENIKAYGGELLYTTLSKVYKVLYLVTKALFDAKEHPSDVFQVLVQDCGMGLTPPLYTLLQEGQDQAPDPKQKKGQNKTIQAQIKREQKAIPNVIFELEKFEGMLIKYSKLCAINLMKQFKRSTARDFRVDFKSYRKHQEQSRQGTETESFADQPVAISKKFKGEAAPKKPKAPPKKPAKKKG